MNKTKIPWCDFTWNPVTGCSPSSEGCANCYAAAIAHRFHRDFNVLQFHAERLNQPQKVKFPAKIFVCSVSDIFHKCVDVEWRNQVFRAIATAPQHTYILLTKRPENIPASMEFPRNVWLGVSVENQARADERIPKLLKINAPVHFISAEPLLGPIDVRKHHGIEWVIAGPETGPKKRPCDPSWIADLYAQCRMNGVAFFDKRDDFKNSCREWPQ